MGLLTPALALVLLLWPPFVMHEPSGTETSKDAKTEASDTSTGFLLVLSKRDHTLAVVDPATLQVKAKVPVGEDPHEVIASTDGKTAFVSNYGSGTLHTLAVVDLTTQQALPPIDLGPLTGPHGLAFVDGKVWFTAEGAKAVGRYDPVAHKVDWILGTGQNRTHMLFVAPGAERLITTNVSSGTVSLIAREPLPIPPPPPRSVEPVAAGQRPRRQPPESQRPDRQGPPQPGLPRAGLEPDRGPGRQRLGRL